MAKGPFAMCRVALAVHGTPMALRRSPLTLFRSSTPSADGRLVSRGPIVVLGDPLLARLRGFCRCLVSLFTPLWFQARRPRQKPARSERQAQAPGRVARLHLPLPTECPSQICPGWARELGAREWRPFYHFSRHQAGSGNSLAPNSPATSQLPLPTRAHVIASLASYELGGASAACKDCSSSRTCCGSARVWAISSRSNAR